MNILCERYLEKVEYKIDTHINHFCACHFCIKDTDEFVFEALWSLLNLRGVRRRNYLSEQDKQYVKEKLRDYVLKQIQDNKPINFFFFDLPIKTGKNKTSPDIGEYLMFAKLNLLAKKFEKVYHPGIRFNILSDGFLFVASGFIFKKDYLSYLNKCNEIIRVNNFGNVSVVDSSIFFNINQQQKISKNILSSVLIAKIKKRLINLNKEAFNQNSFDNYLNVRNLFELHKQAIKNLTHAKFGFYITKIGFKKEHPVLSIYTTSSDLNESPSRGKVLIYKKGDKYKLTLLK